VRVATLVEWLQSDADEATRRPQTAQEALDELFRLQERYLGVGPDQLAPGGDQVADVGLAATGTDR
jgi:hypothetical protein